MLNAIAKLYYTITEVSKIIGEEQHVLRYWEREFPQLKPQKNRAGNRVYTDKDVATLRVIQRLLRLERYTVAGAREYLRTNSVQAEVANGHVDAPLAQELQEVNEAHEMDGVAARQEQQPGLRTPSADEVAAVVRELRSISEELRKASTNAND